MYEKALIRAGLNEKQAKVYLACLELGRAKAPEIARISEIKRTTTYGILDELVSLGLLSYAKSGKAKIFKAQDPQILLQMLDTNKTELLQILPTLSNLFTTYHHRPRLEFFEGKEAIKRIFEDSLNCQEKKILQIVRVRDFIDVCGKDYSAEYIRRRAEKGITAYALHPKSGDIHDSTYGELSQRWKRRVRYLPLGIFYAAMIMVYDDKVAMVSTRAENFGFIIESKEFSFTLKAYFEFMWSLGSKEPEKNIA